MIQFIAYCIQRTCEAHARVSSCSLLWRRAPCRRGGSCLDGSRLGQFCREGFCLDELRLHECHRWIPCRDAV